MKKALALVLLCPFALALAIINRTCLLLDEVFYPSYRHHGVGRPVFIVGMTRTASSWLHKTLYADRERFTSMKLWEMLFAPSVIQKKGAVLLRRLDKRTGGLLTGMLMPVDRFLFKGFDVVHPTSLFEVEEDDLVLIHRLSNTFLAFIFPRLRWFRALPWFDDRLDDRQKRRIMHFFHGCIQRHLFVFGAGRTYLSKSPCHTPKISSLRQEFPGSRFICTYREPAQAIPSSLSLFARLFELFKTKYSQAELVDYTLRLADFWYAYPLKVFAHCPPADVIILDFGQLTARPEQTIRAMYKHFGWSLSDAYGLKLALTDRESRAFKSSHRYSASDFMLRAEDLAARFKMPGPQEIKKGRTKSGLTLPESLSCP
jgi:hypothetical protein